MGNGRSIPEFDHFREMNFFVRDPRGGFLRPDVHYSFSNGAERRPFESAPRLDEHRSLGVVARHRSESPAAERPLPLAGIRVADFTAFWAGPLVGRILAELGADVLHIESASRPDGMRFQCTKDISQEGWWDWTPFFHVACSGKRSVTIDMQSPRGGEIGRQLAARCDVVIENFSPRVSESWGLTYEWLRQHNPALIMARLPAFGTSGPWRERVGFAQTMEQISGLTWRSGFTAGAPVVPNGPCDPIAALHSTQALLLALVHRDRTGCGMLMESPMIGAALSVAAEQVIEYSAYGHLIERSGADDPVAMFQNMYLCGPAVSVADEQWVLVSVDTSEQHARLILSFGLGDDATSDDIDASLSQLAFACDRRVVRR